MNQITKIAFALFLALGAVACGGDPNSMADDSGTGAVIAQGGSAGQGGQGGEGNAVSKYAYPADVAKVEFPERDVQGNVWTCPSHRPIPAVSIKPADGGCIATITATNGTSRTVYGTCWDTVCCPGCWDGKTCHVDGKLWTDATHYPTLDTSASSCQ